VESANIKTLTPSEVGAYQGNIVKIRFICRDVQVEQNKDGTFDGFLCAENCVRGRFPASASAWFQKVTTNQRSRVALFVFGKIGPFDPETNSPTAVILGRELRTDLKGATIVW
jgi:hypothetical protein